MSPAWWRRALAWFGIGTKTLTLRSYDSLMGALDALQDDIRKGRDR